MGIDSFDSVDIYTIDIDSMGIDFFDIDSVDIHGISAEFFISNCFHASNIHGIRTYIRTSDTHQCTRVGTLCAAKGHIDWSG